MNSTESYLQFLKVSYIELNLPLNLDNNPWHPFADQQAYQLWISNAFQQLAAAVIALFIWFGFLRKLLGCDEVDRQFELWLSGAINYGGRPNGVNSDTMPRCMISKERMMHGVKSVPASCANPDTAWCRICQGPATEYPLYRLNCQCQGPENLVHQACLISTLNDSRFDPTCCYVCQCKWTMNRPLCSFYQ